MLSTTHTWQRLLMLGCCLLTTGFACSRANGQALLISLTNSVWKYEQDRNMDDTGWQSAVFNDETWSSGLGLFGFEVNPEIDPLIQTRLQSPQLPAPGLGAPRVYYFRTQFDYFHGDFSRPILIISNRLDDGAVFYLNGEEVKRIRIADGPVRYFTMATNTPTSGDATGWDVFELDNPPLRWAPQRNVLAVEVHQRGLSGDIVFGSVLSIEYVPYLWPTPTFQVVTQCNTASISVPWDGGIQPASFQWLHNGIAIDPALNPTATNTTLVIPNMQQQHVGHYQLSVIYRQRPVMSSAAFLSLAITPNDWQGSIWMTTERTGVRVNWDGCGALEHSTNLVHWSDVPANPISPYDVPPILDRWLFFRVRR